MPRAIDNASDNRHGPFPIMGIALDGWQNFMSFRMVTDTIVNFEDVKTEVAYPFEGVFQPMRARELYLKPEGERNWKWWTLWTKTKMTISNGDIIEDFRGTRFKVMKSTDWGQAGIWQYELLEDYETHS